MQYKPPVGCMIPPDLRSGMRSTFRAEKLLLLIIGALFNVLGTSAQPSLDQRAENYVCKVERVYENTTIAFGADTTTLMFNPMAKSSNACRDACCRDPFCRLAVFSAHKCTMGDCAGLSSCRLIPASPNSEVVLIEHRLNVPIIPRVLPGGRGPLTLLRAYRNLEVRRTGVKHEDCFASATIIDVTLQSRPPPGSFKDLGGSLSPSDCRRRCCAAPACDLYLHANGKCMAVQCMLAETCRLVRDIRKSGSPSVASFVVKKTDPAALRKIAVQHQQEAMFGRDSRHLVSPVATKQFDQPLLSQGVPTCEHGAVLQNYVLTEKLQAGRYMDHGQTPGMDACIGLCCASRNCDAAFLLGKTCFSVQCRSHSACAPIPARSYGYTSSQLVVMRRSAKRNDWIAPQDQSDDDSEPPAKAFVLELNITNIAFKEAYRDLESLEFINLASILERMIASVMSIYPEFITSRTLSVRPGKLILRIQLTFKPTVSVKQVLNTLANTVRKGQILVPDNPNYTVLSTDVAGFKFSNERGQQLVCFHNRDYYSLWPMTPYGTYVNIPCPRRAKGLARRKCVGDENEGATWTIPNFTGCTSIKYEDLHRKVRMLHIGQHQDSSGLPSVVDQLLMLVTLDTYGSNPLDKVVSVSSTGAIVNARQGMPYHHWSGSLSSMPDLSQGTLRTTEGIHPGLRQAPPTSIQSSVSFLRSSTRTNPRKNQAVTQHHSERSGAEGMTQGVPSAQAQYFSSSLVESNQKRAVSSERVEPLPSTLLRSKRSWGDQVQNVFMPRPENLIPVELSNFNFFDEPEQKMSTYLAGFNDPEMGDIGDDVYSPQITESYQGSPSSRPPVSAAERSSFTILPPGYQPEDSTEVRIGRGDEAGDQTLYPNTEQFTHLLNLPDLQGTDLDAQLDNSFGSLMASYNTPSGYADQHGPSKWPPKTGWGPQPKVSAEASWSGPMSALGNTDRTQPHAMSRTLAISSESHLANGHQPTPGLLLPSMVRSGHIQAEPGPAMPPGLLTSSPSKLEPTDIGGQGQSVGNIPLHIKAHSSVDIRVDSSKHPPPTTGGGYRAPPSTTINNAGSSMGPPTDRPTLISTNSSPVRPMPEGGSPPDLNFNHQQQLQKQPQEYQQQQQQQQQQQEQQEPQMYQEQQDQQGYLNLNYNYVPGKNASGSCCASHNVEEGMGVPQIGQFGSNLLSGSNVEGLPKPAVLDTLLMSHGDKARNGTGPASTIRITFGEGPVTSSNTEDVIDWQYGMFGGDILVSINIIEVVMEISAGRTQQPPSAEELQEFLDAASAILDLKNAREWVNLMTLTTDETLLMKLVNLVEHYCSDAVLKMSKYNQELQHPMLTKNLMVQLVAFDSEDVGRSISPEDVMMFPDQSQVRQWSSGIERVELSYKLLSHSSNRQHMFYFSFAQFRTVSVIDHLRFNSSFVDTDEIPSVLDAPSVFMGSAVVSLSINPLIETPFEYPVHIVMENPQNINSSYARTCAYWNASSSSSRGAWMSDGCEMVSMNSNYITCECNHLTSFAITVDQSKQQPPVRDYPQPRVTPLTPRGPEVGSPADSSKTTPLPSTQEQRGGAPSGRPLWLIIMLVLLLLLLLLLCCCCLCCWCCRRGKGGDQAQGPTKPITSRSTMTSRPTKSFSPTMRINNFHNNRDPFLREKAQLMSEYHQSYSFSALRYDAIPTSLEALDSSQGNYTRRAEAPATVGSTAAGRSSKLTLPAKRLSPVRPAVRLAQTEPTSSSKIARGADPVASTSTVKTAKGDNPGRARKEELPTKKVLSMEWDPYLNESPPSNSPPLNMRATVHHPSSGFAAPKNRSDHKQTESKRLYHTERALMEVVSSFSSSTELSSDAPSPMRGSVQSDRPARNPTGPSSSPPALNQPKQGYSPRTGKPLGSQPSAFSEAGAMTHTTSSVSALTRSTPASAGAGVDRQAAATAEREQGGDSNLTDLRGSSGGASGPQRGLSSSVASRLAPSNTTTLPNESAMRMTHHVQHGGDLVLKAEDTTACRPPRPRRKSLSPSS